MREADTSHESICLPKNALTMPISRQDKSRTLGLNSAFKKFVYATQWVKVPPILAHSDCISRICSCLILLDIMMPDMDGYEVCSAIKADERAADIPIIFISALDEVFDKMKAFSRGGVDYITKPFQPEEVLARIETHWDGSLGCDIYEIFAD